MTQPDRLSPRDRLRRDWQRAAALVRRFVRRWGFDSLAAPRHPRPVPFARRPIFEALESRLLLAADPILAPAVDLVFGAAVPAAEFRAVDLSSAAPRVAIAAAADAPPADAALPSAPTRELVFIDASVPDCGALLADLLAAADGRSFEVFLIEAHEDGVARITDVLARCAGIDAVHVVSHGEAGAIRLGSATLDLAALEARSGEVASWARAFAASGDLLLYGCDVAATVDGRAFAARLAELTGADVAASENRTGSSGLGGDWRLEATTGLVETPLAFSSALESSWLHVLAAEVLDWDSGGITLSGSAATFFTTGAVNTGTGTVTVTVQGYTFNGTTGSVDSSVLSLLTNGTPAINTSNTGGLSPTQNSLAITSTGFERDDPANPSDSWQGVLITLDFSHPGGVGNVSFSVFDIDVGGGGSGFVDEVVAVSDQGAPTLTSVFTPTPSYPLAPSAQVISPGVVRGTGTYNSGSGEPYGNATFLFTQTGITQVQIFYKNAGNQTTQGISLHDIRFDTGLFANDDTATTPENAVLNVTAANGVLKNDGDNQPFTGSIAPNPRLNYDAATDVGGNSLWTDDTLVAGFDWQFLNSVGLATNATQSAAVTTRPGITSAYVFGGTVQEARTSSLTTLAGDPSDGDATFELWFKPADVTDADILFEAGGQGNVGTFIGVNGTNLVFYIRDGGASASVTADLSTLIGSSAAITGEYIHVVATYDRDASGTTDVLRLYVNGVLAGSNATQTALNDWASNDQTGLAGATGNFVAPAGPAWSRFEGAIARVRFYDYALTAAQVQNNYNAVAEGLAVSGVSAAAGGPFSSILPGATGTTITLPSGAIVTMRADGSYTYNPNGAFNALNVGQTATDTFYYRLTDNAAPTANTTVAKVTITITGVGGVPNSPPVVDLDASAPGTGFATTYTEDTAPIAIVDTDATITDSDTANMTLASITLVNPQVGDELSVVLASLPPGISVAPGSSATQIFLTGSATKAAYQTALQAVRFMTLGDTPSTVARTIEIYVSDGLANSNTATATVTVVAVNDDPVNVGALPPTQVVSEDLAGGLDLSAVTLADPDAGVTGAVTLRIVASAGTLVATSGGGVVVGGSGTGTLTLTGDLASLNAFIDAAGSVAYTGPLDVNGSGAATLALAVSDNGNTGTGGGGFIAVGTVSVDITAANDAPVASGSATLAAVLEDTASPAGATVAALFAGNYSDAIDGPAATPLAGVAIVGNAATGAQGVWEYSPDGTAWTAIGAGLSDTAAITLPDTYRLRFRPAADFNGTPGALTVRLSDGSAGAIAAATGINIAGAIGGTSNWSAATVPLGTSITAVNDAPVLTIGPNQTVAEDGGAQTVPGFASATPGGGPYEAGQSIAYLVVNDNNALFAAQPAIDTSGQLTYTLAANAFGSATVTVQAQDNGGTANGGIDTSAAQTFTITVTPVADTPSVTNATTLEDTLSSGGLVVTRNAADGAEVTHYKITAITGGTLYLNDGTTVVVSGSFITAAEGAAGLRFLPAPDSIAPGSFDVQASTSNADAGLGGAVVTVTISVTPVNDQPTFTLGANPVSAEDAGAQTVAGFATGIAGGGPDEAGQSFVYTVSGNTNPGLFAVAPSIAADGTLTYTAAANASGTATITVYVTDSGGTAYGGIDTSAAQTFAISVTPVADAPSLVVAPASGNEDGFIPISVAPTLVDADGSETLTVTVAGLPVGARLTDGVFVFDATPGHTTADVSGWNYAALAVRAPANSDADLTLTVTATATEGANLDAASTLATLDVTVNAVADAPSLVVAPATGNEDTPIALTVAPALVDTDGSESLTVTLTGAPLGALVTDGTNGILVTAAGQVIDLTGWNFASVSITPPANDNTDFVLTIAATATEANGGATATTTLPLAVTVNPVNDAPLASGAASLAPADEDAANPPGATVASLFAGNYDDSTDGPLATPLAGIAIVANAATAAEGVWQYSPDGVAWTSIPAAGLGDASALTLPATYLVRFLPAPDYNGTPGALAVRLSDGASGPVAEAAGVDLTGAIGGTADWSAATVALATAIDPVNDAPVLANNGATVNEGATVTLTSAALLASDIDNTAAELTYTVTALPAHGQIFLNGVALAAGQSFKQADIDAGRVTYVHDGSETIADQFTFTLADGAGASLGPATFAITVNPVDDAPAIVSVALRVVAGESRVLTAELIATDVDTPASQIVWTVAQMTDGRFERIDAPGVPITSFTQAEIDAGLIRFVSTDLGRAPSFVVFVSDGTTTVGPQAARVSFNAFTLLEGVAGEGPLRRAAADDGFTRVGGFVGGDGGGGLLSPLLNNFVRHPTAPEVIETAGARPEPAAAPPEKKPAGVADKPVFADAGASIAFSTPELSRLDTSEMRVEVISSRGVDLDRALESEIELDTIRLTGMVLSVGFVWWALRASGLLASMLASAPAWRHIDPLPVLSSPDKGQRVAWTPKPDVEAEREEEAVSAVLDKD